MFRNNIWYKRFGWKRNPFSIKINDSVFVGLTEERRILANLVEGGNICMIIGDNGVGKSSLLKWLEKRVRKHYFVYLSAEWVKNNFDLNAFIDKQRSFFGNYPKNIVLLVDESQKLENWFRIEIQALWEKNIVKGIVFSHDGEGQYENLPNQLKSRISNRIIRINRLKKEDAYELIRLRCGGKNPFDEYAMDEVIKRSNGNPRKILENCERVCITTDKDKISKYEAARILDNVPDLSLKIKKG